MKCKQIDRNLLVVILLVLFPTAWVFALELSPAGGGALGVTKRGGYAFVEDHDDFDANLVDEATIEMWIYLKRAPKFRESWVLLHKEESYLLTLSGHSISPPNKLHHLKKDQIANLTYFVAHPGGGMRGSRIQTEDNLPLNQWHHLAFILGNKASVLYLNGKQETGPGIPRGPLNNTHFPLSIGGTGVSDTIFEDAKWLRFTGGLIDEVRVSDIARYPLHKLHQFGFTIPDSRFKPDKNTLALWHFDGGRAEWLKDASGNEHTLTDVDLAYFYVDSRGKLPTLWGEIKRQRE